MAFYGPKKINPLTKDTIYYSVPDNVFLDANFKTIVLDTVKYPVFLVGFIHTKFKDEGYKMGGLLDYTQYNPEKLNLITTFLISEIDSNLKPINLKKELKIKNKDVHELYLKKEKIDSITALFFKQKPIFVFDYSFALIDKQRHIRGYYDPNFVGEIKRMIQEYEHLKLRDEKANMIKKNTIKVGKNETKN